MLGHASCPEDHGNPRAVAGDVFLIAQAQVTACARGAMLVDVYLGAHGALLITLLGNVAAVQSNERQQ